MRREADTANVRSVRGTYVAESNVRAFAAVYQLEPFGRRDCDTAACGFQFFLVFVAQFPVEKHRGNYDFHFVHSVA